MGLPRFCLHRSYLAALLVTLLTTCDDRPQIPKGYSALAMDGAQQLLVASGDKDIATAYYKRIGTELQFDGFPDSTLAGLLDYAGYGGLAPEDFQNLDSVILMEPSRLALAVADPDRFRQHFAAAPLQPDEIVSIRFFAPKIIDLTGKASGGTAYNFGWRKLVRLRVRAGSRASAVGIASASILFNFLAAIDGEPFLNNTSKNTQVMLVRDVWRTNVDPTYWLVYGELTQGGPLIGFLTAGFELPATAALENKYWVPTSCAECHGVQERVSDGSMPIQGGRLNYLDTDHWNDRVQPGDDFAAIVSVAHRYPLVDAGADPATPEFKHGFDNIRRYNSEVLAQNQLVDMNESLEPGVRRDPSLQTRGARTWQALHPPGQEDHVRPVGRGLEPLSVGDAVWSAPDDSEITLLLNRYCFRCHSSIVYSVLDKKDVLDRSDTMERFIRASFMPQDRTLRQFASEKERLELTRLAELLRAIR